MIKNRFIVLFAVVSGALTFLAMASSNAQETSADFSGGSMLVGADTRSCDGTTEGNLKYDPGVSDTGLVGHWRMDETGVTTTATDSSTNTNNGSMENGLTGGNTVSRQVGTALNFDGTDDSIDIAANPDYSLTSFTYAAWVNIPTTVPAGWKAAMAHDRGGTNWVFLGKRATTNLLHFRWSNADSINSTTALTADRWYHIAGTYDLGSNTARVYVEGVLEGTDTTGSTLPIANDALLRIGRNTNNTEAWQGYIDDVRIYNRGGSVCLNRSRSLYKWISALRVMPQTGLAAAR